MVRVLRRQCEGPHRRYAIHDDRLHRTVTIREVARTAGEVDRHRLDLPSPAPGLSSDRAWWSSPATQCGSRRRGSIVTPQPTRSSQERAAVTAQEPRNEVATTSRTYRVSTEEGLIQPPPPRPHTRPPVPPPPSTTARVGHSYGHYRGILMAIDS
jgi:hypothetical protein